ncbi:hypothetical protein GCM10011366_05220 [Ornithinimicrobium tianjinense]|uniref:Uncharacterized protein n=1 Tax=Ornithinimicrobium tianjinense TaxID=1195761 RepID=A0A917BF43_9MICO|nr:hypothetical protein GCM10011366_05220 [Ornithinimicrobium tianjinense]
MSAQSWTGGAALTLVGPTSTPVALRDSAAAAASAALRVEEGRREAGFGSTVELLLSWCRPDGRREQITSRR